MHSKADNCRFRNRRFVSADRGNPNVWGFSGRCKMNLCRAICIAWDFLVTAIIKSPLFTFFNAKCFSQSTQNSLGLALLCSSVGKSDLFMSAPAQQFAKTLFRASRKLSFQVDSSAVEEKLRNLRQTLFRFIIFFSKPFLAAFVLLCSSTAETKVNEEEMWLREANSGLSLMRFWILYELEVRWRAKLYQEVIIGWLILMGVIKSLCDNWEALDSFELFDAVFCNLFSLKSS